MDQYNLDELFQFVEEHKYRLLRSRLAEMNEADIAEFMEELDRNQGMLIFRMLPKDQAADVFAFLEPDVQEHIINSINDANTASHNRFNPHCHIGRLNTFFVVVVKFII